MTGRKLQTADSLLSFVYKQIVFDKKINKNRVNKVGIW